MGPRDAGSRGAAGLRLRRRGRRVHLRWLRARRPGTAWEGSEARGPARPPAPGRAGSLVGGSEIFQALNERVPQVMRLGSGGPGEHSPTSRLGPGRRRPLLWLEKSEAPFPSQLGEKMCSKQAARKPQL